jgi:hypothetical protein
VRWGLAASIILLLVAAGCGGGGAIAVDPVASAADRTLDKQTGRFELNVSMNLPQVGRTTVSGEGTFDTKEQSMDLTMAIPNTAAGAPTSLDLRMLYPVMYVHLNGRAFGTELPSGKSWVKIDLQKALSSLGVSLPELEAGGNQSPTEALAQLRGSKDAEQVGTETVDGVRTTHYRVKVDLEEALDRATPKEREALQGLLDKAKDAGVDVQGTKVDVWVGADGLVRRTTEELGNLGTVTMTFSDYGTPVAVEAPPADETIDVSGLLGGG